MLRNRVFHGLFRWVGLIAVLGLANSSSAPAATITFNPAFGLGQSYTSNALFTSENEISDSYTTISLYLPVTQETKKSETSFIYSPAYQFFNSATQLDNLSHTLDLIVQSTPSRTATIDARASYYHGQDQGSADSTNGSDLILTSRNTRDQGRLDLAFGNKISGRWRWGASTYYESLKYSSIKERDDIPEPFLPQNRTALGAAGQVTRNVSSRRSIGLELGVDQFDLDFTGTEDVGRVSFVFQQAGGRHSSFSLRVGAYQSSQNPEFDLPIDTEDTITGFQGDFSYTREFKTFDFNLLGSHQPTYGYDRFGTSTNSYLTTNFNKTFTRRIDGGMALRWARSAPTLDELPAIDSLALSGGLSFRPIPSLALQIAANVVDQTSGDTSDTDPSFRNVAVLNATFTLVWSPWAQKPIAGGSSGSS